MCDQEKERQGKLKYKMLHLISRIQPLKQTIKFEISSFIARKKTNPRF